MLYLVSKVSNLYACNCYNINLKYGRLNSPCNPKSNISTWNFSPTTSGFRSSSRQTPLPGEHAGNWFVLGCVLCCIHCSEALHGRTVYGKAGKELKTVHWAVVQFIIEGSQGSRLRFTRWPMLSFPDILFDTTPLYFPNESFSFETSFCMTDVQFWG